MYIEDEIYNEVHKLTRDFILKNKINPNTVNVSINTFMSISGSNTTRYQPAYLTKDGEDRYAGMWLKISNERNTYVSLN